MKVLFDEVNPKEVLFFDPMIKEMEKRGHEVVITTRKFEYTNKLQKELNHDTIVFGFHGSTLKEKLMNSLNRMDKLVEHVNASDAVVCLAIPDTCRVAYGLAKPLFCFNDIPEAEAQSRLTNSLSTYLLIPSFIPESLYTRFGTPRKGFWKYDAMDPVIWLQGKEVDQDILKKLGLDDTKPVVVFRESETLASYLDGKGEILFNTVEKLMEAWPEAQFVCRPRYSAQGVKERLPSAIVIDKHIDLQSLLAKADLFIGGGGTMNIEACYFGTPTISTRRIDCIYENFLLDKGLSVKATSVEEAVNYAKDFLGKRNDALAKKILGSMVFPTGEIIDLIEDECKVK
ncbi:MAG: DUF354 domain-containing protein [Candidatus Hodarchaeota archaeon]